MLCQYLSSTGIRNISIYNIQASISQCLFLNHLQIKIEHQIIPILDLSIIEEFTAEKKLFPSQKHL